MAALNLTSFDSALKQHYTAERVEMMVYKDHPFLALVPKFEKFGGRNLPIPIWYGVPQGRSATFATAQTNKKASKFEDYVLTRAKDYGLASIDNETLDASKGNVNAFLEAATAEIDGALLSVTRSLATALYRDGTGTIGKVAAGLSLTLTLGEANDIVNFEVGMELAFNASGSERDSGEAVEVTAIDRSAGTMTVSPSLSTIASIAISDGIHVMGDFDAKVKGLEAWIPSALTASESFFGVDRNQDATRLAGNVVTGTGRPIEEALIDGANRVAREGGKTTHCFLNYDKFAELEKSLGSKVQYVDLKAGADIAFRGIMVHGPRGPIQVTADQNCQDNIAWMLDMSSWKMYTLGKAPRILSQDGLRLLRENSSDAVEVRTGYYGQLGCRAPGWNARVSLD